MLTRPVTGRSLVIGLALGLALSGCIVANASLDEMFPPRAGDYLRTSGPAPESDTGVEMATYQGPGGVLSLRIVELGEEQVGVALTELPPMASNIGYDPALGQREGVFFDFGDEYHAAWGNGDWLFVLSAPTAEARVAFLAGYGY